MQMLIITYFQSPAFLMSLKHCKSDDVRELNLDHENKCQTPNDTQ